MVIISCLYTTTFLGVMCCDNVVHVIIMHYHLCDITCGKMLGYYSH